MFARALFFLFLAAGISGVSLMGGVAAHAGSSHTSGGSVQVQTALDGTGMGKQETNLGDLVADAARQEGGADIALIAADEISEAKISTGSVPLSRIVDTLTYASDPTDTIVVLKLTGAQLTQVLERSVSRAPQAFDGYLQVSGLTLHYDPAKPEGSRLVEVRVGGAVLDAAHNYTIATTRPVADGSFGYFRIWSPQDIVQDTHTSLASGLSDYLNSHRSLNVTLDNRISP